MCGEQSFTPSRSHVPSGSSPRVRGTDQLFTIRQLHVRFIPACAGNSASRVVLGKFSPVHPRVCGEQHGQGKRFRRAAGSSPRVRGTVSGASSRLGIWRFIPACAGNRARRSSSRKLASVHPRVCGEQFGAVLGLGWRIGSSPRVRGTDRRQNRVTYGVRFIPACAGNSEKGVCGECGAPVHPRVCGEQSPSGAARSRSNGSSPRVRGTVHALCGLEGMPRFIPACAGNSCRQRRLPTACPVHPRVCGEQRV